MSALFRSPAARDAMLAWHERFRARIAQPLEARVVETAAGQTHCLVGGPEGAPPLVLLHGAMASSAHVLSELPALLERFRVYAVDVLGQSAKSADVRVPVKGDAYGRWLRDTYDGLGLARAHLVGISWGGFVAQRLAALAPERVERLALLVPAGLVVGPAWASFRDMGLPLGLYLAAPSPKRLDALMRGLLTTQDDEWRAYLGEAFLAYRVSEMKVPPRAQPGEFAALKAPVLVMGADRDVSFPGGLVLERARALFPTLAETELLKDCRHSPPTTPEFRAWLGARLTTFLLPT